MEDFKPVDDGQSVQKYFFHRVYGVSMGKISKIVAYFNGGLKNSGKAQAAGNREDLQVKSIVLDQKTGKNFFQDGTAKNFQTGLGISDIKSSKKSYKKLIKQGKKAAI